MTSKTKFVERITIASAYFFFFLSGTCGLIYEVVWHKQIGFVMGHTVYALTTVLAAFMGGLALGSYFAGRYIDKFASDEKPNPNDSFVSRLLKNKNAPLLIYGILEGLIGIYCLLLPVFIDMATPLLKYMYNNFHASFYTFSIFRFIISALLLILPTAMMGATLPILVKFFTRTMPKFGSTLSRVYAINTFGATLGAFLAGFVLIPAFGVGASVLIAAITNFAICALSILLFKLNLSSRKDGVPADSEKEIPQSAPAPAVEITGNKKLIMNMVLFSIALSGFISFVYQTVWTKVLSLIIGNSTYSFSIILVSFILGIGIGSWIISRYIDRIKNLVNAFGMVELGIGLAGLVVIIILGNLSYWMLPVIKNYKSWHEALIEALSYDPSNFPPEAAYTFLRSYQFVILTSIMIIPTTLIGATFPIAAKLYSSTRENLGKDVGKVYAFNTIGCIIGAFVAGFVFIEFFGMQNSLKIAVVINLMLGVGILFFGSLRTAQDRSLGIAALVLLTSITIFLPHWHTAVFDSGIFHPKEVESLYEDSAKDGVSLKNMFYYKDSPLFFKEGSSATVSVWGNDEMYLRVNGKTDASTVFDLPTQMMVGHLPLLLHDTQGDIEDDNVLVIGLGCGMTAAAVASHPVEKIDVVELCPEVIEAAKVFEEKFTHHVLSDPRVNVIIEDGRNHVTLTEKKYDVIISEPTNPWIAGVANLFTQEFFELCKARLSDKGLFCQWVQAYEMSPSDFKMILRTFLTVFPNATLWEPYQGSSDFFLIGTDEPMKLDYQELVKRLEYKTVKRDMEKISRTMLSVIDRLEKDEYEAAKLVEWGKADSGVLLEFIMGSENLKMFAYSDGNDFINTDNHNILEYSAPKNVYANHLSTGYYVSSYHLRKYMQDPLYMVENVGSKDMPGLGSVIWLKIANLHSQKLKPLYSDD